MGPKGDAREPPETEEEPRVKRGKTFVAEIWAPRGPRRPFAQPRDRLKDKKKKRE